MLKEELLEDSGRIPRMVYIYWIFPSGYKRLFVYLFSYKNGKNVSPRFDRSIKIKPSAIKPESFRFVKTLQ